MTRQNLHKRSKKDRLKNLLYQKLRELVIEVRKEHPRMSARKIHKMLHIKEIGINKFEQFVSSEGLKVQNYRSFIKTTRSGRYNYPNLTNGLVLKSINQLWASDITYFVTPEETLYFVIIIDVYSRRIIGYCASDNLMATNNVKALNIAFRMRRSKIFKGLIHHSDKGSQYGSKEYLNKLIESEIRISMAENSLENAYAERVIGILKNEYLLHMGIKSLKKLQNSLSKVVKLYNEKRPHIELGYLTPNEFEKKIIELPEQQRPLMQLYDFRKNQEDIISRQDKGFTRHESEECFENKKKSRSFELIRTTAKHSTELGYSLEGCSPAEPSSTLPNNTKFNIDNY
jgi:transposase InsO family protein